MEAFRTTIFINILKQSPTALTFHSNIHSDKDDCSNTVCRNDGTCVDQVAGYICLCAPGFTGSQCEEDIDDCDPNPCLHGRCTDDIASFGCNCVSGYTGLTCGIGMWGSLSGDLAVSSLQIHVSKNTRTNIAEFEFDVFEVLTNYKFITNMTASL